MGQSRLVARPSIVMTAWGSVCGSAGRIRRSRAVLDIAIALGVGTAVEVVPEGELSLVGQVPPNSDGVCAEEVGSSSQEGSLLL